jgi:hypothetical protein
MLSSWASAFLFYMQKYFFFETYKKNFFFVNLNFKFILHKNKKAEAQEDNIFNNIIYCI